jgi:hypothetical protein
MRVRGHVFVLEIRVTDCMGLIGQLQGVCSEKEYKERRERSA